MAAPALATVGVRVLSLTTSSCSITVSVPSELEPTVATAFSLIETGAPLASVEMVMVFVGFVSTALLPSPEVFGLIVLFASLVGAVSVLR